MKRGKLNKSRAIMRIVNYLEDCAQNSNQPDVNVFFIKLADDLKRKKISRVKKKFIRYHTFFDDIIT